jgi:hypothetical protein
MSENSATYRVGRKLGTTIYRNNEEQPSAWTPGNAKLAARIVLALNAHDDLLAALKSCVDGLGCQPGYVNTLALSRAQHAIAKAESRK